MKPHAVGAVLKDGVHGGKELVIEAAPANYMQALGQMEAACGFKREEGGYATLCASDLSILGDMLEAGLEKAPKKSWAAGR